MNHSGSAERAGSARVDVRAGDVVLERVHELVAEHVVGRCDRAGKRQNDAALVGFGDAAGALAEIALDGVGLPEMRPARVEDERLPCAQLMIEQLREARVPALGHPRRHLRRRLFLRVVVDVEVVGLQDLEVEFPVLNLVAAEVAALGKGSRRQPQQNAQGCRDERGITFHMVSLKQRICRGSHEVLLEKNHKHTTAVRRFTKPGGDQF